MSVRLPSAISASGRRLPDEQVASVGTSNRNAWGDAAAAAQAVHSDRLMLDRGRGGS
jgi:hypothetical protein